LMVLPPVIFLGLAALFWIGMQRDDPNALPSTRVGSDVPVMTVNALANEPTFDAEALRAPGVKLVNFWASWCAPCRLEHPSLEALADDGITLYGINYKDDPVKAVRFLNELGNPFTAIVADDTGRTALDWGVYGVPETFVVNGQGQVTFRFAGPITADIMQHTILPEIEAAR